MPRLIPNERNRAMKVTIKDVHRHADGEYDLDIGSLTNGEYHEIKKVSGVRAAELPEALRAGDISVVVAFAKVALMRAQQPPEIEEALWVAPGGSIGFDFAEEGDEEEAAPLDL